jgi:hypothetical protein
VRSEVIARRADGGSALTGMKIAIPDDYQDAAPDLAGWGSQNAKAEVVTAPFAGTDGRYGMRLRCARAR